MSGTGGTHEGDGRGTLRAPTVHRALAALACPVLGYFVARLLVRFVPALPAAVPYAVCLAAALLLGWRAWSARVVLGEADLRVHNTLATTTIERPAVRRVSSTGRVEWLRGDRRPVRVPSEALSAPWWTFGASGSAYAHNRERVESWTRRSTPRRPAEPTEAGEPTEGGEPAEAT
ncbi:hypothetical protein GCM10023258_16120 [Terrabacter aeriphilus]|uniref:PH domain-containing protein n=1 Tax=Terrabacter aeriphilus TaxID=515662 RepID=A0ABP9JA07_9MICO